MGLFSSLNHQILSWLFCHNEYFQHFPCARVKPVPSLKYRADHIEHFDLLQDEQDQCGDRSIREFESNKGHYSMAKQYRRPLMQMPLHYCSSVYSLENFLIVATLFIFMLFPDDISFLKWKAPQCRHTLSISHFKYWHRRSLTSGIFRSSSLLLLLSFFLSLGVLEPVLIYEKVLVEEIFESAYQTTVAQCSDSNLELRSQRYNLWNTLTERFNCLTRWKMKKWHFLRSTLLFILF
jgi:hypothetical protein